MYKFNENIIYIGVISNIYESKIDIGVISFD